MPPELVGLEVRPDAPERTSAYLSESKVLEFHNLLQMFTFIWKTVRSLAFRALLL